MQLLLNLSYKVKVKVSRLRLARVDAELFCFPSTSLGSAVGMRCARPTVVGRSGCQFCDLPSPLWKHRLPNYTAGSVVAGGAGAVHLGHSSHRCGA